MIRFPYTPPAPRRGAWSAFPRRGAWSAFPPYLVLAIAIALQFLVGQPAGGAAPARDWRDFPALTHLRIEPQRVIAVTDADSAGLVWSVAYDRKQRTWSRPTIASTPVSDPDSLASVRVFSGGIFDKYPVDRLALGGAYSLERSDTGFVLIAESAGPTKRLGWPVVEEDEIGEWAKQVRYGLPRDETEERLIELFHAGKLQNVPGPTVEALGRRWFGLAGGFVGGEGHLGGLVSYDATSGRWKVHRHVFLIDAAVTVIHPFGEDLWIGTARYGPLSMAGVSGLVRYRPSEKEWRQYSTNNSRISGNLVWDVAGEGKELWVTTNEGVSRYDLERKLWTSWYWYRARDGGWMLDDERPDNPGEELLDRPG